jgi:hypothetical protein
VGQDRVKLAHSFGQRCGARLENIGRFDFVDVAAARGFDRFPAGARPDFFFADSSPAPGTDDHIGIGANDFSGIEDAVLRVVLFAQVGKYGLAAGDFDQFFYPADAADQRVHPLFEVDAWAAGESFRGFCDAIEFAAQAFDQRAAV